MGEKPCWWQWYNVLSREVITAGSLEGTMLVDQSHWVEVQYVNHNTPRRKSNSALPNSVVIALCLLLHFELFSGTLLWKWKWYKQEILLVDQSRWVKVQYKMKRCSKTECYKQCRHDKLKGTMTKWPVHVKNTQKVEHQNATHSEKNYFLRFSNISSFYWFFIWWRCQVRARELS